MTLGQIAVELGGDEQASAREVEAIKQALRRKPLLALAREMRLEPSDLRAAGAATVARWFTDSTGKQADASLIAHTLADEAFDEVKS